LYYSKREHLLYWEIRGAYGPQILFQESGRVLCVGKYHPGNPGQKFRQLIIIIWFGLWFIL
jgi:hypothetical protein